LEAVARAGMLTDIYSRIVWEGVFMAGMIECGDVGVATLWEEWFGQERGGGALQSLTP
jgi:hypothetical protein